MKILVIPDSFKGSLSSEEFCAVAQDVFSRYPDVEVKSIPIGDGGEGTLHCLIKIFDGKILETKVTDGNMLLKKAMMGYCSDRAFISVAESSGLPKTLIKDPLLTTTAGVGEQILQAKHLGKKKIVLLLGGSSTNDGGAGLVHALGGKFFDEKGERFLPTGGTLKKIAAIDLDDFYKNIDGMEFTALCDVNNPLLGENGCSRIFAPQKGAKTEDAVRCLEENMTYYADKTSFLGCDPSLLGAGAAGGLGYCVAAFLHGKLISGIDFILDSIDFNNLIKEYDYIVTGEGKWDATSLRGKAVGGIWKRASKQNVPVVVFCGTSGTGPAINMTVYPINDKSLTLAENIQKTREHLEIALVNFYQTKNG